MQITLDLENFNVFIIMYIKAILHQEIDHKKGLEQKIMSSNNADAKILFKDRERMMDNGQWDVEKERGFNDKLNELMPDLRLNTVNEFDWFLDIIDARNIDNWLIQHYFRQSPEIRLYLNRFITSINNSDDVKVRLII